MRTAILTVLLMALAPRAWAWGPAGHRAIASLAERQLDQRASAAIRAILRADVSLADISNCADGMIYAPIRCADAFDIAKQAETAPWHFINIPITGETAPLETYCPRKRGSRYGDCIVDQLKRQVELLGDSAASLDDRRMALLFVVHLMGDIHQPLHLADDEDKGGAKKKVVFAGLPISLHQLWDASISQEFVADGIARFAPGSDNASRPWKWRETFTGESYAQRLENEALSQEAGERPWELPGALIEKIAWETYELGKTQVYPAFFAEAGVDLGGDYRARMRPLAERQILRAGQRLAYILNSIFSDAASINSLIHIGLRPLTESPLMRDPWSAGR